MVLLQKEVCYASSIQLADPTGNARLVAHEWEWEFELLKIENHRKESHRI